MRGKQRYRCKACGLNFTDTPPRGMPLAMKAPPSCCTSAACR
jgi:transposase-like protein